MCRSPTAREGKQSLLEIPSAAGSDEVLAEVSRYLERVATTAPLERIATERYTACGAVAPKLLEAAQSLSADLLVVCRHGLTGPTHWGLGNVASKLVQRCPVPLLLLPDEERTLAALEQHRVRALVALDGSSFSEAALEPMACLLAGLARAGNQQGTMLLLQVVGTPASYGRFRSQVVFPDSPQKQREV